jgi:hypothetical protein
MKRRLLKTTGHGLARAGVRRSEPRATLDERRAWRDAFAAFEVAHGRKPPRRWGKKPA